MNFLVWNCAQRLAASQVLSQRSKRVNRSPRDRAQRLAASQVLSLRLSTRAKRSTIMCSTPRGITGTLTTFTSGYLARKNCAQRLAASQVLSPNPHVFHRARAAVLNASRHHRYSHSGGPCGSPGLGHVLNASRHHRYSHESKYVEQSSGGTVLNASRHHRYSHPTARLRILAQYVVLNASRHHRYSHG